MEFPIALNKFEKEKRVIELHLQGKTIRRIASEVHMSFRDISKIIKAYDKKVNIELKKENINLSSQKIKKLTTSSQAFKLFSEKKNPIEVAIELNIDFEQVRKYWTEFLQLNKMKKLYNIYVENEYHLDYLFRIYYFLLRNEIPIKDMENILKRANDVINLNQTISNLKAQIEKLNQIKNNYSSNQNTNHKQLLSLGLTKYCYVQY